MAAVKEQIPLKAEPDRLRRWREAAASRGESFADWARRLMDAAALGTASTNGAPLGPEFGAALDRLGRRYPVGSPAALVRMSVISVDRMIRGGTINPFDYPDPDEPASPASGKR